MYFAKITAKSSSIVDPLVKETKHAEINNSFSSFLHNSCKYKTWNLYRYNQRTSLKVTVVGKEGHCEECINIESTSGHDPKLVGSYK